MARILLIEDEPVNRTLFRRVLEWGGHEILEAPDGQQGIHLALDHKPDLILMDLSLPHMDGWMTLEHLRRQQISVPIVALTAHAMSGDRERVLAAGFNGYLSKPIDVRTFNQSLWIYLSDKALPSQDSP